MVRCPYCQHAMELKGAHAGKFTPKCPGCKRRFMLLISDDPNMPPMIGEMPAETSMGATTTPAVQANANANGGVQRRPNADVGATLPPNVTAPPPSSPSPPARASASPYSNASATAFPSSVTMPKATLPPAATPPVGLAGPAGDMPARTFANQTVVVEGPELSGTLGGYELVRKLGQGGMGTVYLARQVSLDRPVALKVLSPELAEDPQFVARFTREAYAAAQLSHHNVVQIHDIGVDDDTNFFSMEFVPGQTLDRLVKHDGKLDPQVAVGYILQAARGLRFAHDHGLIHRDVKPDNLLLNEQGIVKVADLGLVKQAGNSDLTMNAAKAAGSGNVAPGDAAKPQTAARVDATQFHVSMGTPAYMPPEQARDAANVDQRADVYSLGCTLYDLLTGQPPFTGKTAVEVITKHQTAPVVPPDRMARHVSPELSSVVMRMMAKRPEDRYQSMAEVVQALESILGVDSGKPFSPQEEHVDVLESVVADFNGAKWAALRRNLVIGFFGGCAALAVVCPLIWKAAGGLYSGAVLGFVLLTCLSYQVVVGITRKTYLASRARQYMVGARWADYLKIVAGLAILVLLLVAFDLHRVWLGAAAVALVVAIAFHFSIDRMAERERVDPVHKLEDMLKKMRLRGLDEAALRQFVCKYSGERWEELYEMLFSYEAKRAARRSWGKSDRGRDRKRFAAWRDAIIDWMDRREVVRRETRERRMLAKIESKALTAKGIDLASANRKAKQAAERLVDKAARVKESADRRAMMTVIPSTTSGRQITFAGAKPLASWADGFEEDGGKNKSKARDGEREHESYLKRRFGSPLDYLLGAHPRILVAAAMIFLFALWVRQNGGFVVQGDAIANASDAVEKVKAGHTLTAKDLKVNVATKADAPLRLPHVPDAIEDAVANYNGGLAGALLMLSAFFSGKRLGLAVWIGALMILGSHLGIPTLEGRHWIAAAVGTAVVVLGIVAFRKTAADG